MGLMVLLIAMIYFMMIRPQKKKEKAEKEMRESLKVGDEVVTIGGVVGRIEKINEKTVILSTGAAKNKIEFLKTAIGSVSSREPSANDAAKKLKEEKEAEEAKAPSRSKKVTPKKLTKKSDDEE